jgi:hypothetical protein
MISPVPKAGLRSCDELPALRGFLKVSFIPYDCHGQRVPLVS